MLRQLQVIMRRMRGIVGYRQYVVVQYIVAQFLQQVSSQACSFYTSLFTKQVAKITKQTSTVI